MSCSMCDKEPTLYCRCKKLFFCVDHIGLHLNEYVKHKPERLRYTLNDSDILLLKNGAISSIIQSEKNKTAIINLSSVLIKEIEKFTKKALYKLDSYYIFSSNLITLQKFPKSLKNIALKLYRKEGIFESVSLDMKTILKKAFDYDPETYKKIYQNEQKLKEEMDKKIIENERMIKIEQENIRKQEIEFRIIEEQKKIEKSIKIEEINRKKLEEVKKEITKSSSLSNSWELIYKQEIIESLLIPHYQDFFARNGTHQCPINEIKFSLDSKYSFICKSYEGTFK